MNTFWPSFSVAPRVAAQVQAFELRDVRLLDGPFLHAQNLDRDYLLSLEPDRLLHGFRVSAGLQPKAPLYGGWESMGIAGHTLGHYLTAVAQMWASTGDERLLERLDATLCQLEECQRHSPDGYLGAIPDGEKIWEPLRRGEVRAGGFDLNGGWVPWYTQHKIFAGLRDAYLFAGDERAQTLLLRLSDWAIEVTAQLDDARWHEMLRCEHGGMNEVLADVYALSGDPRYLELARRFSHRLVLEPLSQGIDALDGMHANTQIPKVIGFERLYQLEGDAEMGRAARFFWRTVTQERSFATGGNSDREHFFPPSQTARHLSPDAAENCNAYNMLRLTRALYQVEPSAQWMEFYERALFNQILSSQDPVCGGFNYLNSLQPGGFKVYSNPTTAFWCCVGSGMENHAKYGESIYFHDDDSLFVNLFIASQVTWAAKGLTLTQNTRFPDEETARFALQLEAPTTFALRLRHPQWANGAQLKINGEAQPTSSRPGSYESIERQWHDGDRIEWTLPLRLHCESLPHSASQRALLLGPIVLAADLGREGLDELDDYVDVQTVYSQLPAPPVPVLVGDWNWEENTWAAHLTRAEGASLAFEARGLARHNDDSPATLRLIPFSQAHHRRYTVYFDTFSRADWQARRVEIAREEERRRQLAARTLDQLHPHEQQSEIDHALRGHNSRSGDGFGGKWRNAQDGFFEFEMRCAPDARHELSVTYWGADGGNRRFDILVGGAFLAQQTLDGSRGDQFFDQIYPVPLDLTRGQNRVTVRFESHPGAEAGGVFGVRMLRVAA